MLGIEGDLTVRPMQGLKITATMAYTDSHFRNYIVGGENPGATAIVDYNYSANHMIYAPKFSGSLNAEYTAPTSFGKVVTAVGLRHISPYDEQISLGALSGDLVNGPITVNGNDPRVRTITQDLVDASITANFKLQGTDAYVRVFGRNLADIHTTTAAFTVAGLWAFGSAIEPRTYGATVGVKF